MSTTLNNELLPCPFCGFHPDIDDPDTLYPTGTLWRDSGDGYLTYHRLAERQEGDNWVYGIHCVEHQGGCGVEIDADTKEEAIKKWNTRHAI